MKVLVAITALWLATFAVPAMSDDSSFVQKAAQGGMAEVEASQLAANKATNSEVRKFALMLVKDHGAANEKLAEVAKSEGMKLPDTYGDTHKANLQALQAADGARFDQAYLAQMVKSHEQSVQALKAEIEAGQKPAVKAFAQEILPTVESHLREAYRLTGKSPAPAPAPN
jgi:putative membrane protein